MRHFLAAALLIVAGSSSAFACGEEGPEVAADGSYALTGVNLDCRSHDGRVGIKMRFTWRACSDQQTIVIARKGHSKLSYKDYSRDEHPDVLRTKPLPHEALLMTMRSSARSAPAARLVLTRDPKRDSEGKNFSDAIVKLPAYTGRLKIGSRKVDVLCQSIPQSLP